MTENGLFVLGSLGTHLHDILWAVHDIKNHGRTEGWEIFTVFPVTVGGRGRAMQCGLRVSLSYTGGLSHVTKSEREAYAY